MENVNVWSADGNGIISARNEKTLTGRILFPSLSTYCDYVIDLARHRLDNEKLSREAPESMKRTRNRYKPYNDDEVKARTHNTAKSVRENFRSVTILQGVSRYFSKLSK